MMMDGEFLRAGAVLHGKYRINGVIGQGGFGITYDGTDLKLDMHVAIKEYFPRPIAYRQNDYSQSVTCTRDSASLFEHGLRNFLKEAKNMARFAGEANFVFVQDFFEENNTAYIIMEFVQGQNLKKYLNRHGRLSFREAMTIAFPVMNALEKIHAQGLIHRDVSPSNIMILPDGRVKLLDFGAVREVSLDTQSLTTMSAVYKYGYSPIEQQTGGMNQGTYSDIYALCATIYQMLTGLIPPSPFARLSGSETLNPPSRMGVEISPLQEQTLMRGLAVYGPDRPQTVYELREGFSDGPAREMRPAAGDSLNAGRPSGSGSSNRSFNRSSNTGGQSRLDPVKSSGLSQNQVIGILVACIAVLTIILAGILVSRSRSNKVADGSAETAQADAEEPYGAGTAAAAAEDPYGAGTAAAAAEEDSYGRGTAGAAAEADYYGAETAQAAAEAEGQTWEKGTDPAYDYPEGTLVYKGHHYYIYNDSTGSWKDARDLCLARGGHMAVINDAAENEELYQYMCNMGFDVAYFGLIRLEDYGEWDYYDGESSTFRNWGMNSIGEREPNDEGGPSRYAAMNIYMSDGHWDDVEYGKQVYTPEARPYKNLFTYICEWDE